jgi:predicted secreted hydrolase
MPTFTPIKFPRDEAAHHHIIEWWYFNGRLQGRDGRDYAFMNCLFRADAKKVKIPFLAKLPVKILYFYHSLLSDISRQKFTSAIEPVTIVSDDSFSKPLLFINHTTPLALTGYTNCVLEETSQFVYRLKDANVDLELISTKPPLLEGGRGYLNLHTKNTYYYSLTNLKTRGRIKVGGRWVEVTGKSWMDHQWANTAYSHDQWTWFSIQLDNRTDMVCFIYEDQGRQTALADILYADGRQESCPDVLITAQGDTWISPKTKAVYPLTWTIQVPSQKLELTTRPLIPEQEMLFGSINYWEGPLNVSGRLQGRSVRGVGFMELAGYPSQYTRAKYIKDELEKTISKIWLAHQKIAVTAKLPKLLGKLGRGDS